RVATLVSASLYGLVLGTPVALLFLFGLVLAVLQRRDGNGLEPLLAQFTLYGGLLIAVAVSPWVRSLFFGRPLPLYCVDKPLGLSSHDVVARARRRLGTRRVGHAGTLDPLATGVLLLLTQEATKLSQFVTGDDKSYLAWVTFGLGTPTLDAEGPVTSTADASGLDRERLAAALPAFLA